MTVHRLAVATNRKSVPRKPRYFSGWLQADLLDLLLDAGDDDLEQVLPARTLEVRGQPARDEHRADHQHEHQPPGEHDGGVELEQARTARRPISSGLRRMAGLLSGCASVARPGQPRHDQRAPTMKPSRHAQQPLPVPAARRSRSRPGRCPCAAAGCRGTTARAAATTAPCAPSTTGRRRTARRARRPAIQASTRLSTSLIVIASCSSAWPGLPWRPSATRSGSRARARRPAAPASRSARPGGAASSQSRAPRRAASVPPPTSRSVPSCPGRTTRPAWRRGAPSLRAAFAPTCSARVGSRSGAAGVRLVSHGRSREAPQESGFQLGHDRAHAAARARRVPGTPAPPRARKLPRSVPPGPGARRPARRGRS